MDAGVLQSFVFFIFCIFLISDSSIAEKTPSQAIWQSKKLDNQENQLLFSSRKPDIPIVNPTTPSGNPPPTTNPNPSTNPNPNPNPNPTTNPNPNPNPTTNPYPNPNPTTNPNPNPTTPAAGGGGGGAWCIASPTASQTALQVALDYACGFGGADCSAIQPGAACSYPSTVRDHASYAFNDYYQKNPIPTSCSFGGTAQLTYTDPSNGNCHYASPRAIPTTAPPIPPTPPGMNSPVTPMTPTGPATYGTEPPAEYGSEPTGTPSSAHLTSQYPILLLFTAASLVASLVASDYF